MATQKVIWTVLPKGFTPDRELIVSLVPSFRLTPQAPDEQVLKAFRDLLDWPGLLAHSRFQLRIGVQAFDLRPISVPSTPVWQEVFPPSLPVAGYVFNDLSKHNLRSFPVRTVVSYLHTHYGELADQDGLNRPSLFGPDGARLQGMLADGLPVTVMWGELDDAWPTAVKMRMAADLGAPDIEIPGAGHSPNADQPELLVEYLMRARHL